MTGPEDHAAPDPPARIGAPTPSGAGDAAMDEHFLRHESARLRAVLIRRLGSARLDLVEDVIQETLLSALRDWRFHGLPNEPAAWLTSVAQRKAIDHLRRDQRQARAVHAQAWVIARVMEPSPVEGQHDDTLRLMLLCAHPVLAPGERVLLTLALVAGFGIAELARAFVISQPAAEQRLTRAKRTLRDSGAEVELPSEAGLVPRLESLLDTLYLMLNEGHVAHGGDHLVRRDLVDEVRRLLALMLNAPWIPEPWRSDTHALAALASFTAARLDARTDESAGIVLMEDQDRTRWDRAAIGQGYWHLARVTRGDRLSAYALEAGIASSHAGAPSFAETDWAQIVAFYDLLERVKPSPIVSLNKAVAIAMRDGPEAGLRALDAADTSALTGRYAMLDAARGTMLLRAGRYADAAAALRRAMTLPCSEPERTLLAARLKLAMEHLPVEQR